MDGFFGRRCKIKETTVLPGTHGNFGSLTVYSLHLDRSPDVEAVEACGRTV